MNTTSGTSKACEVARIYLLAAQEDKLPTLPSRTLLLPAVQHASFL